MSNYGPEKKMGYLHEQPTRSAQQHRANCHASGLDDRVSCETCAGFLVKTRSAPVLDDKTRQAVGFVLKTMGQCRWIYGSADPERLHRCNSYQLRTSRDEHLADLKRATGQRRGA